MDAMLIGVLILFLAIVMLLWQLIKLKKDFLALEQQLTEQQSRVQSQDENLKKTLAIMQDLAKQMHQQQEILERQSARLTQVEIQNAELVTILTQSMKRKD